MFFASTMVMVSIALVMAVIVTNIYAKKDTPTTCPRWAVRLAARFFPANFLPPSRLMAPRHRRSGASASRPPEIIERFPQPLPGPDGHQTPVPPASCPCSFDENECRYYNNVHSAAAAATCRMKKNRRRKKLAAGSHECKRCCYDDDGMEDDETTVARCSALPWQPSLSSSGARSTGGEEEELSKAEWRLVAKFVDRVFFWTFVVMSLMTHCNLFLQMVPETRRD